MGRSAALLLAVLAACSPHPAVVDTRGHPARPATTTSTEPARTASVAGPFPAITELARPVVAEPDPTRPRYDRDEWDGKGWADDDGDRCNTRAEVLQIESSVPTTSKTTNCTVLTGAWTDPYTGQSFTSAAAVQIDHLVALGDAASSGGWAWPEARKVAFANDLDDAWQLNAVSGAENQRKADHGPDRWLPPAAGFRCTYVAAYSAVKARWGLTVTPVQWAAIESVWRGCQSR